LNNYICVTSDTAKELHKMGFIPCYRELGADRIYFVKTDELCKKLQEGDMPIEL
jgi:hypothetical protein